MIQLSDRARRGLVEAIGIPSIIGGLMAGLLAFIGMLGMVS